jgi:hypothetical protein
MTIQTHETVKEYVGFFGKIRFLSGGAALLIPLVWWAFIFILTRDMGAFIIAIPVVCLFLLAAWGVFNQYPVIRTTAQGLFISHNFGYRFIPWGDIKAIQGDKRFRLGNVYVYSDALPFLYRWYTFNRWYAPDLPSTPAFIIDPTLNRSDLEELVQFIESHTQIKAKIRY